MPLTSLPNLLTLSRILAVPLVVASFYVPGDYARWFACALFSAAGFTDWLDGHMARRWEQQSELGRFLDPIADKLLVAATLFMLVAKDRFNTEWTLLPALVILSREILVSGLREFLAGAAVSVPVTRVAKTKTAIQMVAIGAMILDQLAGRWLPLNIAMTYSLIAYIGLWIAAALTVGTGYAYFRAGLAHLHPRTANQRRTRAAAEPRAHGHAGEAV